MAPHPEDLTDKQLEEFEMELCLAAFERDCAVQMAIDGVPASLGESHRACFRAGWQWARFREIR